MYKKTDDYCYRPQTKFWEGNIFSRVCLSVNGGRGSRVTITHDALELTVQGPASAPALLPPWTSDLTVQGSSLASPLPPLGMRPHCIGTPYQKHQVVNTGDLFNLVHLRTRPPGALVKYERLASGQYVSSFECFLVKRNSSQFLDHNQSAQSVMDGWTDRRNFYNFY